MMTQRMKIAKMSSTIAFISIPMTTLIGESLAFEVDNDEYSLWGTAYRLESEGGSPYDITLEDLGRDMFHNTISPENLPISVACEEAVKTVFQKHADQNSLQLLPPKEETSRISVEVKIGENYKNLKPAFQFEERELYPPGESPIGTGRRLKEADEKMKKEGGWDMKNFVGGDIKKEGRWGMKGMKGGVNMMMKKDMTMKIGNVAESRGTVDGTVEEDFIFVPVPAKPPQFRSDFHFAANLFIFDKPEMSAPEPPEPILNVNVLNVNSLSEKSRKLQDQTRKLQESLESFGKSFGKSFGESMPEPTPAMPAPSPVAAFVTSFSTSDPVLKKFPPYSSKPAWSTVSSYPSVSLPDLLYQAKTNHAHKYPMSFGQFMLKCKVNVRQKEHFKLFPEDPTNPGKYQKICKHEEWNFTGGRRLADDNQGKTEQEEEEEGKMTIKEKYEYMRNNQRATLIDLGVPQATVEDAVTAILVDRGMPQDVVKNTAKNMDHKIFGGFSIPDWCSLRLYCDFDADGEDCENDKPFKPDCPIPGLGITDGNRGGITTGTLGYKGDRPPNSRKLTKQSLSKKSQIAKVFGSAKTLQKRSTLKLPRKLQTEANEDGGCQKVKDQFFATDEITEQNFRKARNSLNNDLRDEGESDMEQPEWCMGALQCLGEMVKKDPFCQGFDFEGQDGGEDDGCKKVKDQFFATDEITEQNFRKARNSLNNDLRDEGESDMEQPEWCMGALQCLGEMVKKDPFCQGFDFDENNADTGGTTSTQSPANSANIDIDAEPKPSRPIRPIRPPPPRTVPRTVTGPLQIVITFYKGFPSNKSNIFSKFTFSNFHAPVVRRRLDSPSQVHSSQVNYNRALEDSVTSPTVVPNMGVGGNMGTVPNMGVGGMGTVPNMGVGGMGTVPNMGVGGMGTVPDMSVGGTTMTVGGTTRTVGGNRGVPQLPPSGGNIGVPPPNQINTSLSVMTMKSKKEVQIFNVEETKALLKEGGSNFDQLLDRTYEKCVDDKKNIFGLALEGLEDHGFSAAKGAMTKRLHSEFALKTDTIVFNSAFNQIPNPFNKHLSHVITDTDLVDRRCVEMEDEMKYDAQGNQEAIIQLGESFESSCDDVSSESLAVYKYQYSNRHRYIFFLAIYQLNYQID